MTVVIAAGLLEHKQLNFHPLVNDHTTTIAASDLIRFLEATGPSPLLLVAEEI